MMGAFGILAAIAVVVGVVQTTVVMTEDRGPVAEETKTPIVEVQAIQQDTGQTRASRQ